MHKVPEILVCETQIMYLQRKNDTRKQTYIIDTVYGFAKAARES
jgi:hypothetical protein